jgi:hypothetical protein
MKFYRTADKMSVSAIPRPGFEEVVTDADSAMAMLRAQRNALLKESDFLMLPDVPADDDALTKYRQALRDLPATTDPLNPVWPEKP